MAFASTQDVGDRLGRTLTAGEETTVELLLDGATAIIVEIAGIAEADLDSEVLRFLTIEATVRALANPSGLDALSEALGAFNYSARFREAGLFLSDTEERLVRRIANNATSGSVRVPSLVHDVYVTEDE